MTAGSAASEAALAYDRWFETPWGRYAFDIEARAVVGALGAVGPGLVLEAGCGTGRFGDRLEAHGANVVGVDRDRGMLDVASRRLAGPCVLADVHRLPFRGGAFAASLAVTVLCFAADPAAALAELARVTGPGGKFVVGELNRTSPWGLARRRRFRRPPWQGARFLSRRRLRRLGGRHGRPGFRGVLFAPGRIPGLSRFGPLVESVGRLAPGAGAFQLLVVTVSDARTRPRRSRS